MTSRPKMSEERVTEIDIKASTLLLKKARTELREEAAVVRDLLFLTALPPGIKLTPHQKQCLEEALRTSLDVVAILAQKYTRAGTELKAAQGA